ncbi:hypothetical protein [Candidatus Nitrospira bockiana]
MDHAFERAGIHPERRMRSIPALIAEFLQDGGESVSRPPSDPCRESGILVLSDSLALLHANRQALDLLRIAHGCPADTPALTLLSPVLDRLRRDLERFRQQPRRQDERLWTRRIIGSGETKILLRGFELRASSKARFLLVLSCDRPESTQGSPTAGDARNERSSIRPKPSPNDSV